MPDLIAPTGPLPKVDIGQIGLDNLIANSRTSQNTPARPDQWFPISPDSNNIKNVSLQRSFAKDSTEPIRGYSSYKDTPNYNPLFSQFENQRQFAADQGKGEFAANLGIKLAATS